MTNHQDYLIIKGAGVNNTELVGEGQDLLLRGSAPNLLEISNLTMMNGYDNGPGGRCLSVGSKELLLKNLVLTDCKSPDYGSGGASIGIIDSGIVVLDSVIVKNCESDIDAGWGGSDDTGACAVYIQGTYGGGYYHGEIIVRNSRFSNNINGGIKIRGNATFESSVIDSNLFAGGIISSGVLTINNSQIYHNERNHPDMVWYQHRGGGIFAYGEVNINKSAIWENVASSTSSSGLYTEGGDINLSNSVFYDNSIYLNGTADLMSINSILYGENFGISGLEERVNIFYSNIDGGWDGEGNIEADPLFYDPDNGNFNLNPNSPCIDAGTAFYVSEGDTLVNMDPDDYIGSAPDMGTIEYDPLSIDDEAAIPLDYALHQNYPNPFNPVTRIIFDLPELTDVEILVYNLLGKQVRKLVNESMNPGKYSIIWNGTDNLGMPLSSGVYIYRLVTPEFSQSKKLILLK